MADYIDRMRLELAELEGRIAKLDAFMDTETFAELTSIDQGLLAAQLSAMNAYSMLLGLRLNSANEGAAHEPVGIGGTDAFDGDYDPAFLENRNGAEL